MSEDVFSAEPNSTFPPVQFSTFVNGDQYVFRADSTEELANQAEEAAEHMERAQKAITAWKQIVVAKGVFTGDSSRKGATERAADTPPPAAGEEAPRCKHGPMKDLAGKGYKKRWYCTLETDNWRDKCKPRD